ncbi:GTP-binding protein, putative [Theileria annulata]|uniref:GTP-binding protein, putative n=1 Tax=Theileria annulata TaxID=5874 RepID=Q4UGN9_THEAN|nr:GTP-binding protein, putative [Theileria annulata]CAI73750.1 GTP-binding protein, putative [Theileria annulata]|eukprot:XP_954427.1 GTP-binding protein, putative [Theileria annulata]
MKILGILRFLIFYTFFTFLEKINIFIDSKIIFNNNNSRINLYNFINSSNNKLKKSVYLTEDDWSDYKLVDLCVIKVSGGDGGDGCMSFRREKHVPLGGANGGNGGPGGDVYIQCDESVSDLRWFDTNKLYKAEDGVNGKGSNKNGVSPNFIYIPNGKGKDMYLYVPKGTVITSEENVQATLQNDGDKVRIARGGRGGKGNRHFITKFNVDPRICERGEEGIKRIVKLIYKRYSDIALIGKPNSGKSSIIKRLTNAKPRIANFPFSTKFPIHGVLINNQEITDDVDSSNNTSNSDVIETEHEDGDLGYEYEEEFDSCGYDSDEDIDEQDEDIDEMDQMDDSVEVGNSEMRKRISLVDVPGLIDGSSQGKGLGHDFLRQIENSNILSYIIDSSNQDPLEDYKSVRRELEIYNPEILNKMEIILLNKIDLIDNQTIFNLINSFLKHVNHDQIYFISAKTGENMDFISSLFQKLFSQNALDTVGYTGDVSASDVGRFEDLDDFRKLNPRKFRIELEDDGTFRVVSPYLERKVKMMRFDLPETMDKLKSILKANKVNKKLIKLGLREGATLNIGNLSFSVQSDNFFQ